MMKICLSILILFSVSAVVNAQMLDVGAGGQVSFPLLYNKTIGSYNNAESSFGGRLSFSYIKGENSFVPNLVISSARVFFPVARFNNDNVLTMGFRGINATINGRFRKVWDRKELQYGAGIGVSYFSGTSVGVNGSNAESISFISDSSEFINSIMPVVNVNAEYIFPISSEVPLYAGIGAQLQYTYFYDNGNRYRLDVTDGFGQVYNIQSQLLGHMINPVISLTIYYRFGNTTGY
jgi:hypothetical protein